MKIQIPSNMRILRPALITSGVVWMYSSCDPKSNLEQDTAKRQNGITEDSDGSQPSEREIPASEELAPLDSGDTALEDSIASASGPEWSDIISEVLALEATQERRKLLSKIMMEIRNRDPSSAALLINALPIGGERIELIGSLIGMSRIDDVVDILDELTNDTSPKLQPGEIMAISNSLETALSRASASEIQNILSEIPSEFQPRALGEISRKYGEDSNVESFSRILEENSSSVAISTVIVRTFFNQYAQKSPEGALRLVENTDFPTDSVGHEAVTSVFSGILNVNRELALSSAMDIDVQDALRVEAFSNVASAWAYKSLEEFSERALMLPNGIYRDIAAEQIVHALSSDEQVERQRWLEVIEDPERRTRLAESLGLHAP